MKTESEFVLDNARLSSANRQLSEQLKEVQDRHDDAESNLQVCRGMLAILEAEVRTLKITISILRYGRIS